MNLYFLVEGKTESKVYPAWLACLLPGFSRISSPDDARDNHYYLISGGGYPSIVYRHLPNAIADINHYGNFHYLVLVIDSDSDSAMEKREEVIGHISELPEAKRLFPGCELEIIVQQRCMETWFLGNNAIFPKNSNQRETIPYLSHFDVSKNNPERMRKPAGFIGTDAVYHFQYLKQILRERESSYSKKMPGIVKEKYYLDALKERISRNSDHLITLKMFFDFCDSKALYST
uniref:DUF4276 family protein n=1 Tax=Candidatus Kentrum sp. LFY TaxID=2126342 RepID=A0A450UJC4_9GAMM|nr:MAG: hypothetical protein BECKLFY1418A_GA0070994_102517 [Candidatus Kentron sp. LFY]